MVGQIGKPKSLPAVKRNELTGIHFSKWVHRACVLNNLWGGKSQRLNRKCTVDSWIILAGRVWVHLYVDFFFSKSGYYNTTQTIGNYRTEGQL